MIKRKDRKVIRKKRHIKIRNKISGTSDRPRLAVYRSEKNIYVQIIDDQKGNTLTQASTLEKEIKEKTPKTWGKEAAKEVGKLVAQRATSAGITQVVFDRGGFQYIGRVKELADGAREAGLKF